MKSKAGILPIGLWIGILLSAAIWVTDSLFGFLWFNEEGKGFLFYFFPINQPHEMIQRFFSTMVLILSGLVVSRIFEQLIIGQKETKKLRKYLQNIVDSMPSMLIGVNPECRITLWNAEAEKIIGISSENVIDKELSAVFPELGVEKERIIDSIENKLPFTERKRLFQTDRGQVYRDVTLFPLIANGIQGAALRITDVTEQVKLEEIMVQSERMLSVGGLAAGMAHEINNPLAGIMQTANVMKNRLCSDSIIPANIKAAGEVGVDMNNICLFMEKRGIPRMIDNILESGSRLAEIVTNMLSFARKDGERKSTYSLSSLIDKTIDLAATDYDLKKEYDFKLIEIIKEYDDGVPPVPCDKGKIQQVLLNILRNGAEAMQEGGTKQPRFTVRVKYEPGCRCSCFEIENNGPGLDTEVRKRIFEPFFTTKPVGMGTGLGMSVSYFIINNDHGGDISVISEPEGGVKFIIRLPVEGKINTLKTS
ncbi:MAG: PAS domain S-box protein [Spirochaetales bacterium]|nr:PAS domain S-box protein [Spirochaetales bacterium]